MPSKGLSTLWADPTVSVAQWTPGDATVATEAVDLGGVQEGQLQDAGRLLG